MEDLINLREISLDDVDSVGRKAAYLGTLSKKFNVAPGYVLAKGAFDRFIEDNQLRSKIRNLIAIVDPDDDQRLQDVANEIQKLVLGGVLSREAKESLIEAYYSLNIKEDVPLQQLVSSESEPIVVVRTSPLERSPATAHINLIYVKGKDKLISSVIACFASLFTASAIKSRLKQHIKSSSMPVIIQKMIMPYVSGRIVTEEDDFAIKACFGMAEEESKLDSYVVSPELEIKTMSVEKQKVAFMQDTDSDRLAKTELSEVRAEGQKLSDKQIVTLARMYRQAGKLFEKPMTIEFIIDKSNYYFIQADEMPSEQAQKEPAEEKQEEEQPAEKSAAQAPPEPETQESTLEQEDEEEIKIDIDEEPELGEDAVPVEQEPEKEEDQPEPKKENPIFSIFNANKDPDKKMPDIEEPAKKQEAPRPEPQKPAPAEKPAEPKAEIHPLKKEEWLETVRYEHSKILLSYDMIILSALKTKYAMVFGEKPSLGLDELVEKLKTRVAVPQEEGIKRIRALRNRLLEQHKSVTIEELQKAYEITERFIREF